MACVLPFKRSLENLNGFKQRINGQARIQETFTPSSESGKWALGKKLCNLGSIHSDVWHGTAADLAERDYIAVYPVIGWWRERPKFERWKKAGALCIDCQHQNSRN